MRCMTWVGVQPERVIGSNGGIALEWANQVVEATSAWVSLIGLLLSIAGVTMTYFQARSARIAAQDAKTAAEDAGQKVIGFDASVPIYNAVEILHRISELIGRSQWSEANWKCVDVRKLLQRALNAGMPQLNNNDEILAVASYLDVLTNNLLAKISNDGIALNVVEIQGALVNHIVAMTGLCEILRQREVLR